MYTVSAKLFSLLERCITASEANLAQAELVNEFQSLVLHESSERLVALQEDCNKWHVVLELLKNIKAGNLSADDKSWLEERAGTYPESIQRIISNLCETTYGVKKALFARVGDCIHYIEQRIQKQEEVIGDLESAEFAPGQLEPTRLNEAKQLLEGYVFVRDCFLQVKKRELTHENYCWLYSIRDVFAQDFFVMKSVIESLKKTSYLQVKEKELLHFTLGYWVLKNNHRQELMRADSPAPPANAAPQDNAFKHRSRM